MEIDSNSANEWMCQIRGLSLFSGSTHCSVDQGPTFLFNANAGGGMVSRLAATNRIHANSFLLGGRSILCIHCRLGTRGDLTCLAVLRKVFCKRSKVVVASVVRRGLDGWVWACVRFTEQLGAPHASLIQDHVRIVLLDVQVAPRLYMQVMPVLRVLQRLGEPLAHAPFHPTQSRVQLESVGSFWNLLRR